MYHLAPEVVARVGVGGGDSNFREFVEATSSAISHNAGETTTPTRGISRTVPQQAPRTGKPTPGTATWDLNPLDPIAAIRDIRFAAENGATRYFQEDEGILQVVHTEQAGANSTTVAVATTGDITLAKKGSTGTDRSNAGTNLSPRSPWDRGLILLVGTKAIVLDDFDGNSSEKVIKGSYLGDVSGGRVTPAVKRDGDNKIVGVATELASAIAATDSWSLVEYVIRRTFKGTVTEVPSRSTSSDTRSLSVNVQLDAFEETSYIVATAGLAA